MPQKRFNRRARSWLKPLRTRRFVTGAGLATGATIATLLAAPGASAAPTPPAATAPAATPPAATTPAATTAPTAPPPLTFLTPSGPVGRGDIFLTPTGDTTTYANGPEIVSPNGKVIWFQPVPQGEAAGDFRPQTYDGHQVLTFWAGTGFGGLSSGTDYIYNDHFQQIATVNAGNGLSADGHEFLITPQNTALILSYQESTADLTSIGGPADQTVINGVVQEIDIRTGRVLFQWNSADHVPFSESEQALPASASTPWDWFHINAVKLDSDGNLLIDSRATWTLFKVNRHTGNIIWQLGGKDSSFKIQAAPGQTLNDGGDIFAWQHDPEVLGGGNYSVFDNESAGEFNLGTDVSSEFPISRVVKFHLDLRDHTATLLQSDNQPESLEASSQGNGQPLPGGGVFTGWGNLNFISEFDGAGNVVFNAEFPTGVNTYRAYLLPFGQTHRGPFPRGPFVHGLREHGHRSAHRL